MKLNKIVKVFTLLFIVKYSLLANAQQIRVIDNKGTIKTANNNKVFKQNTDPNPTTPTPNITVEGDVWIDTSLNPNITKIWNGTAWENLSKTGTTGSVFFAGISGGLEENNSQFFWDNTNNRLRIGGALSGSNKLTVQGVVRSQGFNNSDGTANRPSYRFSNDSDTGMYRSGTDQISFTTGGREALQINNLQHVGIGITPTSRLHINGSVAKSITTTTTDLTLTEIHHTVIVSGNHNITLPAAGGCNGRIYIIKNRHNNSITCSAYKDEANADVTTIDSNTIIHLQSDGTNWQLIAKTPKNYASVETKTGNYVLTAADNGKVINFNSGTAVTLTVPNDLPVGFNISIYQMGAGEVTVIGSRENRLGRYKTAGQYAGAGIVTLAVGTNILTGDLKL